MGRSTSGSCLCSCLLLGVLAGCADKPAPADSPPEYASSSVSYAADFAIARTGTIQGRVLWEGAPPPVEKILVLSSPVFFPPWPAAQPEKEFTNPNAPQIGPTGGVGHAVVYLRHVDPRQCRPWDHGPVTAVLRDYQLLLEQGGQTFPTGFVRRGDRITMVSRDDRYHMIRAKQLAPLGKGAFFTLTLPRPHQLRSRPLTQAGVVELSEAAGYCWLRGYVFVADHPYYTRTDAAGNFTLGQVPPGDYEVTAWMPNWHIAGKEWDPETRSALRLFYRAPVEQTRTVHVPPQGEAAVQFSFQASMFH